MLAQAADTPVEKVRGLFCNETGYQTPKLDTRATIFERGARPDGADDRILLVNENDGTRAGFPRLTRQPMSMPGIPGAWTHAPRQGLSQHVTLLKLPQESRTRHRHADTQDSLAPR